MQHAIINSMKCMRAIKDRIARTVYQLANHLSRASIPRMVYQSGKSSVRDLQSPSAHHSSVVFRHNQSVDHHSDDSVGLFRHDTSVGINNKGKAQNLEELLPKSSKPTNEQSDQISQESSNEQQLCASSSISSTASNKQKSYNRNQHQPTDVAFAKEHQNDAASTNQNDAVALQYLTTDFFPNNQQLVTLNKSNDILKDMSPLPPTADQKRYTQNAAFQLIKTTSPLISDWFLKPTDGHSAGTIPHNATADSATIQQSTPKRLTNTCHFLVNPRTHATAASRHLFKRYY
ncbi:fucosyltransferase 2 [Dorcoceras hygrometricum]|uniref:Fucosyltransferase 2 n=1 Tax=Dorcoceras hygrometricum TaxID=472368 RepID=A0A2Z7C7Z4_9LAMI|nr:fucosyltransferase 2 [Dorcoceras hygrometricum]